MPVTSSRAYDHQLKAGFVYGMQGMLYMKGHAACLHLLPASRVCGQ